MKALSALGGWVPDPLWCAIIAYANRRTEPELGPTLERCTPGGSAVDIGAWYGPWSYWLSRRMRSVIAFEPNPEVRRVLESGLGSRRPNLTVRPEAVSNRCGSATLTIPLGGKGTEGRATLGQLDDVGQQVVVPTIRLDDLGLDDVRFVKIDVEGHELAAVEGALETLRRCRPLVTIELEDRYGPIRPTLDLLDSLGYRGWVFVDRQWVGLDAFDLTAHQRRALARDKQRGYLHSALRGGRYVNNVLFSSADAESNRLP